jgi:trigger factor
VLCGIPIYEIDHLMPYSEVEEHDPENLVLLCKQHHGEKTLGLLPAELVAAANADPYNRRMGVSSPQELRYIGEGCEAVIGSNRHVWPRLDDGMLTVPLLVDDTPVVLFRAEDGHLLLTVQLFSEQNDMLIQIVDNELVFSVEPWDVEFKGRELTVRGGPGDIFVRMKFEPADARITIERGHIWRNGIELEIHPDRVVFLPNNKVVSGGQAVNCVTGLSTGDVPEGIGGAIYTGTMRRPFAADRPSEPAVRKLVVAPSQRGAR